MELEWLGIKILDEMTDIVLVFDDKGTIHFGNRTAAELLQYDDDELKKCNMSCIFRQEFQTEKGEISDFDVGRLRELEEAAMYMKTSACIPVHLKVFSSGQEGTYFLLAQDLTGQRDTNARIRTLNEKEEEERRKRNEFTANVTHELRTPVNGIRGHVMTLMDMIQDEEQRRILEIILYCCTNMSSIIDNILDFSKIESGKFTIDEQEFDFYKMMDKVIATHVTEINKKELRLSVDVDEKIPQLLIGDELRINQILNNLISNAVKFTSVGYINIVVNKTRQVNDEVELFFMVKDSGIGISEAERDRLFQSFSQVDASITRRFGGTGLGLSITKQLVEMMNGQIHVESEKGSGSTFSFFIKLRTNENVSESERQSEVFRSWSSFASDEPATEADLYYQFGEEENREELKKRMNKLVLSIEMGAWDKAETLASTVKTLVSQGDDDIKKQVLRMEMSIRKANHDKSMEMYQKVREALEERIGEL